MDKANMDKFRAVFVEAIEPNEADQQEIIRRLADKQTSEMLRALAEDEKAKASGAFGWFLLFVSLLTIAVAIYMRFDGAKADSVVTLLLSTIPMVAGGYFIQRHHQAKRLRAKKLLDMKRGSD